REVDVVRPLKAPLVDRGEVRRAEPVEREEALRDRLVLREEESRRSRSRVRKVEEIEVGGDVQILRVVAPVGLGEVEDEVGLDARERLQAAPASVEAVLDHRVAPLDERVRDLLAVALLPSLPRGLGTLR